MRPINDLLEANGITPVAFMARFYNILNRQPELNYPGHRGEVWKHAVHGALKRGAEVVFEEEFVELLEEILTVHFAVGRKPLPSITICSGEPSDLELNLMYDTGSLSVIQRDDYYIKISH